MARSLVKGLFIFPFFSRSKDFMLNGSSIFFFRKVVRFSNFLSDFESSTYTGRVKVPLSFSSDRLGHKLGEFIVTKKLGAGIHVKVGKKKGKKKLKK